MEEKRSVRRLKPTVNKVLSLRDIKTMSASEVAILRHGKQNAAYFSYPPTKNMVIYKYDFNEK
jgi:hypothetical protein